MSENDKSKQTEQAEKKAVPAGKGGKEKKDPHAPKEEELVTHPHSN